MRHTYLHYVHAAQYTYFTQQWILNINEQIKKNYTETNNWIGIQR